MEYGILDICWNVICWNEKKKKEYRIYVGI